MGAHRLRGTGAMPGTSHHPRISSVSSCLATHGCRGGGDAQASGFYCPGADAVDAHAAHGITPPGSKPILIDSGAARDRREVAVVTFNLTLEADLSTFDEEATKGHLGLLYGVPASAIALAVEAGSLQLTVTISSADSTAADADKLATTISSTGAAELEAALGSVASIAAVATALVTEEYAAACDAGHWCSVGVRTPWCVPATCLALVSCPRPTRPCLHDTPCRPPPRPHPCQPGRHV